MDGRSSSFSLEVGGSAGGGGGGAAAFRFLGGIDDGGFCQEPFICAVEHLHQGRPDSPQLESTPSHKTVNIERNQPSINPTYNNKKCP